MKSLNNINIEKDSIVKVNGQICVITGFNKNKIYPAYTGNDGRYYSSSADLNKDKIELVNPNEIAEIYTFGSSDWYGFHNSSKIIKYLLSRCITIYYKHEICRGKHIPESFKLSTGINQNIRISNDLYATVKWIIKKSDLNKFINEIYKLNGEYGQDDEYKIAVYTK